jgi:hypothetical protein
MYRDPLDPPYTNHPRGKFTPYEPEYAPLYNYREGFSPFSGYSGYYERRFRFTPTEQDVARAAVMYFRSSPIPADPRYIAPAVSQALYNPTVPLPASPPATAARPAAPPVDPTRPKVVVPAARPLNAGLGRAMIYRAGIPPATASAPPTLLSGRPK